MPGNKGQYSTEKSTNELKINEEIEMKHCATENVIVTQPEDNISNVIAS